jgi:hypothetical protein
MANADDLPPTAQQQDLDQITKADSSVTDKPKKTITGLQTLADVQEKTRSRLASFVVYLFIGINVVLVAFSWLSIQPGHDDWAMAEKLIDLAFTSDLALVSGALGFYFGKQSNS